MAKDVRFKMIINSPSLQQMPSSVLLAKSVGLMEKAMNHQASMFERLITSRVTSDWSKKNQPKWEGSLKIEDGGDAVQKLWTISTPYIYVSGGTSKRYAKMSAGYDPKTRPGVLSSSGAGGRVNVAGRRHVSSSWASSHGIKARNFEEKAAKVRKKHFVNAMKKVSENLVEKVDSSFTREVHVIEL